MQPGRFMPSPAYAWFPGGGKLVTGADAYAVHRQHPRDVKNRYLFALTTEPLKDQRFGALSPADLLAEQLETAWQRLQPRADKLIVVPPPYYGNAELGILLGITQALKLPVAGLVSGSVAATRSRYPEREVVHLEVGVHASGLTALHQGDAAAVRHYRQVDDVGLEALQTAWLQRIAAAFVKQQRFDPLHTAETEQRLVDALPAWNQQSLNESVVQLAMTFEQGEFTAELESLQWVDVVAEHYQRISDELRALVSAGSDAVVQMSERTAALPGLAATLRARAGAEIAVVDDNAIAAGALARAQSIVEHGAASLLTVLAFDQPDRSPTQRVAEPDTPAPTHLLDRSTAYPIGRDALSIGAGAGTEVRRIAIDPSTAGVSQLHCAVALDARGQCVVTDHSRYGTFLNGNRISGSALLQSGDSLRVGTPGVEFMLIRVAD